MPSTRDSSSSDPFITPAQAAQLKNVTRSAIYKAVSNGRLPAEEQLGRMALRLSVVTDWIPIKAGGKRKKTTVSLDVREKISESQKKRWQIYKNKRQNTNLLDNCES